jgi:TetR/AcrR family transcriptional repressor of nem operon
MLHSVIWRDQLARYKTFEPIDAVEDAMFLFWEQGYKTTSVDDLVKRLGIGRGSLYATFRDKRTLFLAALDHYGEMVLAELLPLMEAEKSAAEAVRRVLEKVYELSSRPNHPSGCLMTNTLAEVGLRDSAIAKRLITNYARLETSIVALLDRGRTKGEIASGQSTLALARFLLTVMQGLRVLSKARPDRTVIKQVIAVAVKAIE